MHILDAIKLLSHRRSCTIRLTRRLTYSAHLRGAVWHSATVLRQVSQSGCYRTGKQSCAGLNSFIPMHCCFTGLAFVGKYAWGLDHAC